MTAKVMIPWIKGDLQNSRCLSAGSDSLHFQFKLTIWAQSYNCTISLQEGHFLARMQKNSRCMSKVAFTEFFTSTTKM